MTFAIGDRVTNGSVNGTVEGTFGTLLWILLDGQATPITVGSAGITLEVPLVFEVGKNYKYPGGDGTIFHVVYKLDDDHFIAWYETPNKPGFQVTIAVPAQRGQVVEV